MYNPFKPHIVKFNNGNHGIRKFTLFGWQYLDLKQSFYKRWDSRDESSESQYLWEVIDSLKKCDEFFDSGEVLKGEREYMELSNKNS